MRKVVKTVGFWVLLLTSVLLSTTGVWGSPVPDTGQTTCYDAEGNVITCPSRGEPFYGQDANYTINPPSYTKLDVNGDILPDSAISWTMVRDNVTGLIWEVKQNRNGIQDYGDPNDADNDYTWYDSNPETNGGDAGTPGNGTDTEDFIDALNAANFGGHSDWRLPTIRELYSLVNLGTYGPAIDTAYFPNIQWQTYWSSTTYLHDTITAWAIDFYDGHGNWYHNEKSANRFVRAVRGGTAHPADHFVVNGDGTVTDFSTGLMWEQNTAESPLSWEAAISNCENSSFANYTDWRLPNSKELQSVVDYGMYKPAIDTAYFPNTALSRYWSSTTQAKTTGTGWGIDFYFGYDTWDDKSLAHYVRPVRGGQNLSSGHLLILVPAQASVWNVGETMPITWETQGISGNVSISISRQGGKTSTFETISGSTENDGAYNWAVTGSGSVNCVLKIVPLSDPDKGTIQGLFTIKTLGNTHTITATAGNGGAISPSGSVTVNDGNSQRFTITANSGYEISDVKVDGNSHGVISSYTFSDVTSDHTISASFTQQVSTQCLGEFKSMASMGVPRTGISAALAQGKVYVFGGRLISDTTALKTVEMYDSTSNTWTQKAEMPTARTLPVANSVNDKIYVIGGAVGGSSWGSYKLNEMYDPGNDSWVTKAQMPTARHAAISMVYDGNIYVIGGEAGTYNPTGVVEIYSPETNSWSTGASMPTARGQSAIAEYNGEWYVISGYGYGYGGFTDAVEKYNPATNTWNSLTSTPYGLRSAKTVVSGGKIYCIGGRGYDTDWFWPGILVYDIASDTWDTCENDSFIKRESFAAAILNNEFFAFGGQSFENTIAATQKISLSVCPDCSGANPVVQNVTFKAGTDCTCTGDQSLTIGPGVVVESGAKATFKSNRINVKSGVDAKAGSVVKMGQ